LYGEIGMPVTLDRIEGHTFVKTWLENGGSVVDLGMNQGNFARAIRKQYNCNVVGVEANPFLAEALNEPGSPQCFNLAISAQKGPVRFFIDPRNSEGGSLTTVNERSARPIEVEGIPFAEFYAARGTKDVDLLKIDIEGAEIDLFNGVEPSVFAHTKQICVEFHSFLHPEHLPAIRRIIARMQAEGFYCCDFSTKYVDVLFLNRKLGHISKMDEAQIIVHKYVTGAKRRVHNFCA
jgi:FkbM family methyltransferase